MAVSAILAPALFRLLRIIDSIARCCYNPRLGATEHSIYYPVYETQRSISASCVSRSGSAYAASSGCLRAAGTIFAAADCAGSA